MVDVFLDKVHGKMSWIANRNLLCEFKVPMNKVGEFMAIERMAGIPWHVEKMIRQEGDLRRHRSRCIYYDKKKSHCSKVIGKCIGAAHCNYYEEECVEAVSLPNHIVADKEDFQGV